MGLAQAMATVRNEEAKEYFSEASKNYYEKHYQDINSKTWYPSLYLRHLYTLDMIDVPVENHGLALDIGCGSGAMVRDLLSLGFNVFASDISPGMLEATKETIKEHPRKDFVVFDEEDIEDMSYPDNSFDVIVCLGVIEYLQNDRNAFKEIARVLKPGGIALVSSQNKASFIRFFEEAALTILPSSIKSKLFTLQQHKCHVPWRLDKQLLKVGLKKEDTAYHHFYPVPIPFDRISKRFCVWAGKKMERYSRSKYGWMISTGFVTKYRKITKGDSQNQRS